MLHQPLFGVDSYRAKSMTLVRRLARELDLPVRSFDCGGGCHGTLTDWHNARLPGRAVTVELARTASDWRVRHTARGLLRVGHAVREAWLRTERRGFDPRHLHRAAMTEAWADKSLRGVGEASWLAACSRCTAATSADADEGGLPEREGPAGVAPWLGRSPSRTCGPTS